MKMLAYTNTKLTKSQVMARVRAHREANRLICGTGWNGERGCAVGCTLETYNHELYPEYIGYPVELAYLEDAIFEGLGRHDKHACLDFPLQFLDAAAEGADLSMVWPKYSLTTLSDPKSPIIRASNDIVRPAIAGVAALFREWVETGVKPSKDRFVAAGSAAWAAARAARSAAAWKWRRNLLLRLLREAPVVS